MSRQVSLDRLFLLFLFGQPILLGNRVFSELVANALKQLPSVTYCLVLTKIKPYFKM